MVGDNEVRRIVESLSDLDWKLLTVQLGRYALFKSRRFYWRTGNSGELPYGEVTESIVSKAFCLWLSGRRRWNRSEYPDLESFLKGVIDSLLSHSSNSLENRRLDSTEMQLHISQATPESELLEKERVNEADHTLAEIIRRSHDDPVLLEIINAIRSGAVTRRQIVSATGRTAEDINNGLKRLRRLGAQVARNKGKYEEQQARQ
jgi:hypothetical protein